MNQTLTDLFRIIKRPAFLTVYLIICLSAILSFSLMSGRSGNAAEAFAKKPDAAKPAIRLEALEKRIHELVNKERKKRGLNSLGWSSELSRIARLHSRDMASKNYFSHYDLEGRNFEHRYTRWGFACRIPMGKGRYTLGGENLFQNNLYDSVTYIRNLGATRTVYDWNSLEQIARSTVSGWMKSPGHRKNILQPFWKTEGIGIAVSPDDKVLITQNFC